MPQQMGFRPSYNEKGASFAPRTVNYISTAAFKKGALVVTGSTGEIDECGADPATVLGVAAQGVSTTPGFLSGNSPTVITGRTYNIPVHLAKDNIFMCRGVNGGTDPVTPTQTHVGEEYGVSKVGDHWVMDIAEVTTLVVHVVGIDLDMNAFLVKFISTVAEA